ncbi:MAG: M36 family metallopeptidase [Gemmatimonadota bacterium]|nr:M36 family metallopeptidase [Gemmatimonadota bacterium]
MGEQDWPIILLAFLASGGSAFWAQAVAYASAAKDAHRITVATRTRAAGGGTSDVGSPVTQADVGLNHLTAKHGAKFEFVASGDTSRSSAGTTVLFYGQRHRGIRLNDQLLSVRLNEAGAVVGSDGAPIELPSGIRTSPTLPVEEAVALALVEGQHMIASVKKNLGTSPVVRRTFVSPAQMSVLSHPGTSVPIIAELVYAAERGRWDLMWRVSVDTDDEDEEGFVALVSSVPPGHVVRLLGATSGAVSGTVLFPDAGDGTARVVGFPLSRAEYPPSDRTSFPAGHEAHWVDGSGESAGNNVEVTLGGKTLTGQLHGADLAFDPSASDEDLWRVNAFFTCNVLHDFFWLLGFDEEHGNFQAVNHAVGGAAGDRLKVRIFTNASEKLADMSHQRDGRSLRMRLWAHPDTGRHSALDPEIIAHEYTHGVVTRLIGGPSSGDMLKGKEQSVAMAEGYADYFALTIMSHFRGKPCLALGAWVASSSTGVREKAYGPAFANTYADLKGSAGTTYRAAQVWCQTLLNVHETAGATLAWRLVIDSLKSITPNAFGPTFLHGRDHILNAFDALMARRHPEATSSLRGQIERVFEDMGMGPNSRSTGTDFDDARAF